MNRYNQVPHLTQAMIPYGKVTKTQLNITNESQEVSPFPAGDHKAATNKCETQVTCNWYWSTGIYKTGLSMYAWKISVYLNN